MLISEGGGSSQARQVGPHGTSNSTSSTTGTHRVERGDTLSDLAVRYGTTVDALMKANPNIRDADRIFVGDMLNIPRDDGGDGDGGGASAGGQGTQGPSAASGGGTHRIRPGETLSGLAQRFGATVQALMRANPQIRDADLIYAGATLNIPGGRGPGSSSPGAGATPTAPTAPTAPVSPGDPVKQNDRVKEAMDYFIGQGWTRQQAAGIVANLKAESNFKSDAVGDGGRAYGIAQWHPDRQAAFEKFTGRPIQGSSFEQQLRFVQWELTHTESAAGNKLHAASTAREAGGVVSRYYERPADREGEAARRGQSAEQILAGYRPTPAGGSTGPTGAFVKPVDSKLTSSSEFAMRDAEGARDANGVRHHAAKDWFAPAGTAVRAPVDGTIIEVTPSRGNSGQIFGGVVKMRGDDGMVWVFRHVDPANVREGQKVDAGTRLAGVTNWTDGGDHTHVELWKTQAGGYNYENMVDPMTYLRRFL